MTLLLLDGREIRLDWKLDGETCRFRIESQEEKTADIRQVEPGVYSAVIGGRSYQARVEDGLRDAQARLRRYEPLRLGRPACSGSQSVASHSRRARRC